jgi:hypothetical protein
MERNDWLKAVYVAACRVAEKHGSGLRKAIESKDDGGELRNEVQQIAAEVIAASGELWPFITFSGHPEPPGADWRAAPSFEGAAVRVATAALAADIEDVLESLSTGRALQFRAEKSKPEPGVVDTPQSKPPRGRQPRKAEGEQK